ncbi:MAG TPA: UDP-N-acetylglucosamine 2-epimerase (non-hydrolyzing) [Parachlamydiaceae bacterium]|nr:UDP-N-acetylglucosamine 2-epimerase (non-hydrolyzing) [Parachlamydiaceae bacterium]
MKKIVAFLLIIALPCFGALSEKGPIVFIVGTRPEAIKTIPTYEAVKALGLPAVLLSTGQHKELLNEMFSLFNVKPDYDLEIMKPGQDLFYVTEAVLRGARKLFEEIKPSLVVVQGDTTSAMSASLAAFYLKIPVAHIEAGLRTGNVYAPFPEEINRMFITRIAALNFAPTQLAVDHLKEENVKESSIFLTGNTVVDALYAIKDKIKKNEITPSSHISLLVSSLKEQNKKIILLTSHRRENFGKNLFKIFSAVKKSIQENENLYFVYPMHPNPNIKKTFDEVFTKDEKQIVLLSPLPYPDLSFLLDAADGVMTDSGGIQEEAISLNKMTLILRNETDRPEGLSETARLVGSDKDQIKKGIQNIVQNKQNKQNSRKSPYGDGFASQRIAKIIQNFYQE